MKITIFRPDREPVVINRAHHKNFMVGTRKGCLSANTNVVAGFMSAPPTDVEVMFSNAKAALFSLAAMPGEAQYNRSIAATSARLFCCSEVYGPALIIERD